MKVIPSRISPILLEEDYGNKSCHKLAGGL